MKRGIKFFAILILSTMLFQNALPACADDPSLTLKASIAIAEEALAKAKIDISGHFLFSVTLTHSSKGDYWYQTYRPRTPSEYGGIFVKVYMNGEAEITGAQAPRGRY